MPPVVPRSLRSPGPGPHAGARPVHSNAVTFARLGAGNLDDLRTIDLRTLQLLRKLSHVRTVMRELVVVVLAVGFLLGCALAIMASTAVGVGFGAMLVAIAAALNFRKISRGESKELSANVSALLAPVSPEAGKALYELAATSDLARFHLEVVEAVRSEMVHGDLQVMRQLAMQEAAAKRLPHIAAARASSSFAFA